MDFQGDKKYIPSYYYSLWQIQDGRHETIKPIESYVISEKIKKDAIEFFKPLAKPYFLRWRVNAVRELEEMYRFIVNSAFLNIYNRKIIDNKLVVEEQDFEVAKKLISREIETKDFIMRCLSAVNLERLKTTKEIQNWTAKRGIKNPMVESIMKGLSGAK